VVESGVLEEAAAPLTDGLPAEIMAVCWPGIAHPKKRK
jgi:hypothetical protein